MLESCHFAGEGKQVGAGGGLDCSTRTLSDKRGGSKRRPGSCSSTQPGFESHTLASRFEGACIISWDPVSIALTIAATSRTDSSADGSSDLKICPSPVQSRAREDLFFFCSFPPGFPWEQKIIALQALYNGEGLETGQGRESKGIFTCGGGGKKPHHPPYPLYPVGEEAPRNPGLFSHLSKIFPSLHHVADDRDRLSGMADDYLSKCSRSEAELVK